MKRIWLVPLLLLTGGLLWLPQSVSRAENCDPAYPTQANGDPLCIAPPPPDLNCDDIEYQDFKVLDPDPHKFDRDKDGIGCESEPN